MNLSFPPPPSGPFGAYVGRVLDTLRSAFLTVVSYNTEVPRVILQSPAGKNWALTVADNGALTITNAVQQIKGTLNTVAQAVLPFLANTFKLVDATDNTKAAQFDVSGVSTATTRTLTVPDASGTIALTSNIPAPVCLQEVSFETGAVATGTTVVPFDDTVPTSSEGDQYMALSITPKSATSRLVIEVIWMGTTNAAGQIGLAATLFQDAATAAIAVAWGQSPSANAAAQVCLRHSLPSGTTAATTFKVRVGASGPGTVTFNGAAGGRLFGGCMASSITIREYA